MRASECVNGTKVRTKTSNYGSMIVHRLVPKKESKTTYWVVEVLHSSSSDYDFSFAIKRAFRLSDLVLIDGGRHD